MAGLPPPQLALVYPPHLALVRDGYAIGGRWIAEHPAEWLRLAGRKLRIFWSGAALGLAGHNLPLGAGGIRRAVDLVAPALGRFAALWQLGVLALLGVIAVTGPEPRAAARGHVLAATIAGLLLLGVETARFLDPPTLVLDGGAKSRASTTTRARRC